MTALVTAKRMTRQDLDAGLASIARAEERCQRELIAPETVHFDYVAIDQLRTKVDNRMKELAAERRQLLRAWEKEQAAAP